jgi:hypothetical protein
MIVVNKHASLFWFRAKRFKFDEQKIEVVTKTWWLYYKAFSLGAEIS